MNYQDKYLKYKTKYLELKNSNKQMGGNKNIVIHISGPSGSGKTTLGNKLKKKFGNKIVVKDLDNLRDEHTNKTYDKTKPWSIDEVKYQKYIDDYVKNQKKPLVIVGLNDNPLGKKNIYYNVHAQYKYYIDLDDKEILKQKCSRLLNDIQYDKIAMNDLINNNKTFIKNITFGINHECNLKDTIKANNKWKKDYNKQKYKFMSRNKIYNKVSKLITKYSNQ